MPTVSCSAIVPATAEETFKFISDYHNIPRLQTHFASAVLVGEKDHQPGAEVDLEGRFKGLPMKVRNRIVTYAPPFRMVSVSEGTVLSRNTWELEPLATDPPTTRVTFTVDYKMKGALGGLIMSLGRSLLDHDIEEMTNESLRRLGMFLSGRMPGGE